MSRRAFTPPTSIAPRQAPGGVVLRMYGRHDGKLVVDRPLLDFATNDKILEDVAATAALGLGEEDLAMAGYDGDTGERLV